MSTAEPIAAPAPGQRERRLHPMSWLFVLLQQLKQFIVPILALLVFGSGDRNELWPLIGVVVLVVVSVWRYFTYRYVVLGDRLLVRSGLLERSARTIPFARIHNVDVQQSVLHRVFRVAEVKLEAAGGAKPEAEMRVLALDDALALEALIRQRTQAAAPVPGETIAASAVPTSRLLYLPTAEVLRLGLVSNRGLVVAAAGTAGVMQFGPRDVVGDNVSRMAANATERVVGYAGEHAFGLVDYALAVFALLGVIALLLRLLSVAMALTQYSGFTLSQQGRRLTIERGLAARWRSSLSRRRIQAWTLYEGVVHRWLGRRSLRVDIATSSDPSNGQRQLHELAPIATPQACDALITHLMPHVRWDELDWQPLPRRAWWRLALPGVLGGLLVTVLLVVRFGAAGLVALAWLPWAAFVARRRIERAAYAINAEMIATRDGWWSRTWRFAEIDKVQSLRLSRTPLDRRLGTASLLLDTAGGGLHSQALQVQYIPYETAQALLARLSASLARRPLRW